MPTDLNLQLEVNLSIQNYFNVIKIAKILTLQTNHGILESLHNSDFVQGTGW